jgi:regulator of RNase E activity RraA
MEDETQSGGDACRMAATTGRIFRTALRVPALNDAWGHRMNEVAVLLELSPTTLADCLPRSQVMNSTIRPVWAPIPRIAGPAFTVRCGPGDHLMLHAAIYRAPAGSVVVVEAADALAALAGGNVCAVAQQHGIAGFVLGGAVRDVGDIRGVQFPVFATGIVAKAGTKEFVCALNEPVTCGGVRVAPGDWVVADEEGVVVIPAADMAQVAAAAVKRAAADAALPLEAWEADHRRRIDEILAKKGFSDAG